MKIEDAFVLAILSGHYIVTCFALLYPVVLEVFTSAILKIFLCNVM